MKRQRKSQPNGKSSSEGPALSREQAARAKKTRKSKQQEGSGEEVKIVVNRQGRPVGRIGPTPLKRLK